jgi:small subunit ribosomal protein S14
MAKKSVIARNEKRRKISAKYAKIRAELKESGDYEALQRLPKNASPVRVQNRCFLSGRAHGFMRDFGVDRITFLELARSGKIPGVKKSSW